MGRLIASCGTSSQEGWTFLCVWDGIQGIKTAILSRAWGTLKNMKSWVYFHICHCWCVNAGILLGGVCICVCSSADLMIPLSSATAGSSALAVVFTVFTIEYCIITQYSALKRFKWIYLHFVRQNFLLRFNVMGQHNCEARVIFYQRFFKRKSEMKSISVQLSLLWHH